MAKKNVTKAEANEVIESLKQLFPDFDGNLYEADHEGLPDGCYSIAWEGYTGDYPWTVVAAEHAFTHPAYYPTQVFIEPMNSWSLGLYPA